MKKLLLGILSCMMLCSCTTKKNEEDAILKVAVHSEEYGNQLNELWKENYPEQELEISVVSEEEIETKLRNNEEIPYDVYWIEDAYVSLAINKLLELNDETEVALNNNFNETFNYIKKVYQPIMATSDTYYALDLNKIETDQISEDVFSSIETMSELENSFYYLNNIKFTSSFLTSNINYFPGKEKATLNFNSDSFVEALSNYQKILELIPSGETTNYDNWFINNSHYSGFITTNMQLSADEQVNGGKYKITKLPTINDKQLYTEAISYGYVVNANTDYPNTSKNLVELMHTISGMQLLCNSEQLIPLIPEELISEFTFASTHIQEKTYALNYAIARCFIGVENKDVSAIDYLYLDSTIEKLKECDLENIEACQVELNERYQEWLK